MKYKYKCFFLLVKYLMANKRDELKTEPSLPEKESLKKLNFSKRGAYLMRKWYVALFTTLITILSAVSVLAESSQWGK